MKVSFEQFIAAVKEKKANIVAMSALLTTTMSTMRTTLAALKQAGVQQQVKVLMDGVPITQKYAEEVGADGYSESAAGGVAVACQALGARQ